MIKISPSILSADFSRLGEQVMEAERAGADSIHIDVMDGHFVPNITIGPVVVSAVRRSTKLPLQVHLMIEEPERYVETFADAGADGLTIHIEAGPNTHRTIQQIRSLGKQAGISLNPATPVSVLEEILGDVDHVLVMTVNPGFGGQEFIPRGLHKIAAVREALDRIGSSAEVKVDGGIKADNAGQVVRAGASVLVAGSAIFGALEGIGAAIARLRAAGMGQ